MELIRRCLDTVGQQAVPLPLDPQTWADELAFLQGGGTTLQQGDHRWSAGVTGLHMGDNMFEPCGSVRHRTALLEKVVEIGVADAR